MSVNRSATATKVKDKAAVQDVRKLNVPSAQETVRKQKVKVASVTANEERDIGIRGNKRSSNQDLNGVSTSDRDKVKDITHGLTYPSAEDNSKRHTKASISKDQMAKNTTKKVSSERKGEDIKAVTLEKLIKKAGVEEKLKEFKTATGNDVTKSRKKDSFVTSKSTFQLSSKRITEKRPLSGNTSQSLHILKTTETDSQSSLMQQPENNKKSVSLTSKPKAHAESKDIEKPKTSNPQHSITNQKRKQILSGKQNQSIEHPKGKACDEDIQKWLEGLILRETQKYVEIFGEHEINMQNVMLLTRNDLREMGISALGPLNTICTAIDVLNKEKKIEERQQEVQSKAKSKTKGQSKAKPKSRTVGMVLVDSEVKDDNKGEKRDSVPNKPTSGDKISDGTKKLSKRSQFRTKSSAPALKPFDGKLNRYIVFILLIFLQYPKYS